MPWVLGRELPWVIAHKIIEFAESGETHSEQSAFSFQQRHPTGLPKPTGTEPVEVLSGRVVPVFHTAM